MPGDPALVMRGEERDPAVIEQIRGNTGSIRHANVQYF